MLIRIQKMIVSFAHRSLEMVRFLFSWLITPKQVNEDARRRELILNILLVATLSMLLVYYVLVIAHSTKQGSLHQGLSIPVFGFIIFLFGIILLLSRKGQVTVASHAFIALYFLGATFGAIKFSANVQQILLTFALIIVISSILINTAWGFFVTLLASATVAITWHIQLASGILPLQKWRLEFRETDSLEFIVMFFLIMTVSWLSNREIERSLKRARISEKELLLERNLLEIKIEERTKELKNLQIKQVDDLSQLAEMGYHSSAIFHDQMNPWHKN